MKTDSSIFIKIIVVIIILYSIIQILQFYGIGAETYGTYVVFYVFLFISTFVLPTSYPAIFT